MKNWKKRAFILGMMIALTPLLGSHVFPMPKTDADKGMPRAKAEAQRKAFLKKQAKTRFEGLDSNQDSKVSRQEYLAPTEERFNGADANNDGELTEEEFGDAWVDQMQGIREGFRKKH